MKHEEFSVAFLTHRTPDEVFAAINNVAGWWSGDIVGEPTGVGAEFTYRHGDAHYSRQNVTALIPGKQVAWAVVDSDLSFLKHRNEWTGTNIVFDISTQNGKTELRFRHLGLASEFECYDSCSSAWGMLINGNLRRLIETGEVQPDPFVEQEIS